MTDIIVTDADAAKIVALLDERPGPTKAMAEMFRADSIAVRSSWTIILGTVRPLGAKPAPGSRERQRSRIRERILATGKTTRGELDETRRILKERIAARSGR